jgi:hypothetical protein
VIKLCAHYSKKIPGQQEYSSESASASVELELADGDVASVPTKAAELWNTLKQAVEQQLSGHAPQQAQRPAQQQVAPQPTNRLPQNNGHNGNGYHNNGGNGQHAGNNGNGRKAGISDKQMKFIRSLVGELKPLGLDFPAVEMLCDRLFRRRLDDLDRAQASALIGHISEIKAGRITVEQALAN